MSLQTASRCQPVPSLLFLQNKGRETCSGDLFTSRTISSYIMTQAQLPTNCCSEPGKTIRSPLRAASVHNAGFVPPCHQPWHVRVSPAHPLSSQEEVVDGKEKPPATERQHLHLGACVCAEASVAAKGRGHRGWNPSAHAFLSWQRNDDGKLVVAPQGRDSSDPSAENGMGSFGVWLPALPGTLTDLGSCWNSWHCLQGQWKKCGI